MFSSDKCYYQPNRGLYHSLHITVGPLYKFMIIIDHIMIISCLTLNQKDSENSLKILSLIFDWIASPNPWHEGTNLLLLEDSYEPSSKIDFSTKTCLLSFIVSYNDGNCPKSQARFHSLPWILSIFLFVTRGTCR